MFARLGAGSAGDTCKGGARRKNERNEKNTTPYMPASVMQRRCIPVGGLAHADMWFCVYEETYMKDCGSAPTAVPD